MDRGQDTLKRLRALCLGLPETEEVEAWGHPTFRVGGKIFAGFGEENGELGASFKVTPPEQRLLIDRPRFRVASYVGRFGWVAYSMEAPVDWSEVERLARRSYALVAPRRLAALVSGDPAPPARKKAGARKAVRKRPGRSP